MGRYYSGSIAGKFWLGVQDSDDATKFGGKWTKHVEYLCCNCCVDDPDDEDVKLYCDGCYESFEDHFNDAVEDGHLEQEQKDEPKILINEENTTFYTTFEDEQLKEVQGHIAELEKVVLKFVESITMDAESAYEYDYELHDEIDEGDINKDDLELIARWCLAKQVEKCLIDNGECSFECEA